MHNFCASALLDEYGVRLNVLGRKELLPEGVQRAVEKAENLTRHNDRYVYSSDNFLSLSLSPTWVYQSYWNLFQLPPPPLSAILNLCMPYTSRDEIATAVESTVRQALDPNRPADLYVDRHA